jgi:hypothetical protein
MGVSTNAMFFYGIAFNEVGEFPWGSSAFCPPEFEESIGDWEWHIALAHSKGIDVEDDGAIEAFKEYLKFNHILVSVGTHCCTREGIDSTMYYVYITSTLTVARRGKAQKVDPSLGLEKLVFDKRLRKFCEYSGTPYSEPTWCLASNWG